MNHSCLVINSDDSQAIAGLKLKLNNKLDITTNNTTIDPDQSPILPHEKDIEYFTSAGTESNSNENGVTHSFNYLKEAINAVFLGNRRVPVSNCQFEINSGNAFEYIGHELKITFTKNSDYLSCHISIEENKDCKAVSLDSLANFNKSMSFDGFNSICATVANDTNEPIQIANAEIHVSNSETDSVSITHEIPFSKDFSNFPFGINGDFKFTTDVELTNEFSNTPISNCQLHFNSSEPTSDLQNTLINFKISKNDYTYSCEKTRQEIPYARYKALSLQHHKPPKHAFKLLPYSEF